MRHLVVFLVLLLATACGRPQQTATPADTPQPAPARFRPSFPPDMLKGDEVRAWMAAHYWDRLDLADTTFYRRADTLEMINAFMHFVKQYVDRDDPSPLIEIVRRASTANRPSLEYFALLVNNVLHNPNSPLRDDELFIPAMETILASPLIDEYDRISPEHEIRMAGLNRVGQPANDFGYTTADGRTSRLYTLQADFVLLFINNPGCQSCREIRETICQSPMLSEMIERREMVVLALYPDEDLAAWQSYREQIPAAWINAYDRGCKIENEALYDLRAIPSLYLLDRRKRVLVKDTADVGLIEWTLDHNR